MLLCPAASPFAKWYRRLAAGGGCMMCGRAAGQSHPYNNMVFDVQINSLFHFDFCLLLKLVSLEVVDGGVGTWLRHTDEIHVAP